MYSPIRQVSQSPHSYKHDDNIYTSKSRHEHVMQRIQTFHHQYTNLITNRWGHFANLYKHKPRIPMKKQEACLRRKPHEHQILGDKLVCIQTRLQYSLIIIIVNQHCTCFQLMRCELTHIFVFPLQATQVTDVTLRYHFVSQVLVTMVAHAHLHLISTRVIVGQVRALCSL